MRTQTILATLALAAVALDWSGTPAQAQACDAPAATAHLEAARTHLGAGRYRDAISEYNRAILAAPDCDEAKQGVIEANRALVQRRDGAGPVGDEITRHIKLGGAAFDAGDYERAIAEWEAALAKDPGNRVAQALIDSAREARVDALIEEGSRLFDAGDTQGAVAAWERALQIAPHNTVLQDLLAEGRAEAYREEETQLEDDLAQSMRRIRTALERSRMLPTDDMSGAGLRLRNAGDRPPVPSLLEQLGTADLMEELRTPVSLDFEDTDLRAVLKFISEFTGINFLIDEEVFETLGEVDPDDPDAEKQIKVTIFVTELPLDSALKGMLRQHGLDFSVERDFLYISTPDVLSATSFEQLEVRFYRLRDLARISLPKISTLAAQLSAVAGGQTADVSQGGELVSRLRRIDADTVQDFAASPAGFNVARLLSILRNFVPAVVEAATPGQKQATQAARTEDTVVGGWKRIQETAPAIEAENTVRERRYDGQGREILSRLDYDAATHTLIARNTSSNLDMLERLLDRLDQPSRQVAIESRFLTVSMDDLHRVNTDLSVSWDKLFGNTFVDFFTFSDLGVSESVFGSVFSGLEEAPGSFFSLGVGDDKATIDASVELLTQLENSELVSAPRVTSLSGKPAVIQDVQSDLFVTDVEVDVETRDIRLADGTTEPRESLSIDFTITEVTTGVSLTLTPLILDDNTVRMVLLPDVSDIREVREIPVFDPRGFSSEPVANFELPSQTRQSVYTNCVLKDGETMVLGGLIRNAATFQERSTPFFRDIPILGNFFRSTGELVKRQQLLVFVQANIISPDGLSYVKLK